MPPGAASRQAEQPCRAEGVFSLHGGREAKRGAAGKGTAAPAPPRRSRVPCERQKLRFVPPETPQQRCAFISGREQTWCKRGVGAPRAHSRGRTRALSRTKVVGHRQRGFVVPERHRQRACARQRAEHEDQTHLIAHHPDDAQERNLPVRVCCFSSFQNLVDVTMSGSMLGEVRLDGEGRCVWGGVGA